MPADAHPTAGLHHVTAICGDAQRTVDFYVRVLGLRLLKRTVNFDDPGTYHLYFGDRVGNPGTALTFFAWSRLPEGMLELAGEIAPDGAALLAPRADHRTWYAESFLAPMERNEPWLSSALAWLEAFVGGSRQTKGPARARERAARPASVSWASPRGRAWPWSTRPATPGATAAWPG